MLAAESPARRAEVSRAITDFLVSKSGSTFERTAPEDAPRGSGTDLLLLELATGLISTVGSVGSFDVSEDGRWLAWTTQSPDLIGNGVAVRDFESGVVRALDSERAHYTQLSWA